MGKPALFRNIIGPNSENSHLLLRLELEVWVLKLGSAFKVPRQVRKSTLSMTASHSDISVQGSPTAQKEYARFCRSATWSSYRATPCNLSKCWRTVHFFQWNESEHVVLPIIIIWHSVCWISGALNEHYSKFWALNRALNTEKTRDAQSTKSKFYEH